MIARPAAFSCLRLLARNSFILAIAGLGGCSGYENPVVLATIAVAEAASHDGIGEAEQRRLNAQAQENVARLRMLCAGLETDYRDTASLRSRAAEVEQLSLAVGHDVMEPRSKACVAFHAEAVGHFDAAYRLFFGAAIEALWERRGIAEHGGSPELLTDALLYPVLDAIIRLRNGGHAVEIYHVGSEMVTGYACAQLRRDAPYIATCR